MADRSTIYACSDTFDRKERRAKFIGKHLIGERSFVEIRCRAAYRTEPMPIDELAIKNIALS